MFEHVVRVAAAGIALLNTTVVLSVMSGDLERWVKPVASLQYFAEFPNEGIKQRKLLDMLAEASQGSGEATSEIAEAGMPEVIVRSSAKPKGAIPR